jgi:isoamylase
VPRVSQRLLGSPTQFNHSRRPATTSVNFLAAHDGFTLWDTVSYNDKHNDANGEDGKDGHNNNLSHNLGAEGPTEDAGIHEARMRRVKAMLATLMLSQGVPMILAGDEMGQSQGGNNNAYCQDNEIAWLNWDHPRDDLVQVVADLAAFRRDHALSQALFVTSDGTGAEPQARWLGLDGQPLGDDDWADADLRAFALELTFADGRCVLICLNAGDDVTLTLPTGPWERRIDTAQDVVSCDIAAQGDVPVGWQSVSVFVKSA